MTDLLRASDRALERLKDLHPRKIDLSLERIERLLDALGRPQDALAPVIHVAGTNGKGSTTAFMRAIAEAAGLKVNVLTSPHLVRFVERIRLGGELISEAHLNAVLRRVEAANAGQPITFFEITTAAAILAFAERDSDLCILEVGLGGRFDATNVVARPAVSVIAPVDYDHREFLGTNLAQIAWEKAGVIKQGRPVVSARQAEEAETAIEAEADRLGAPLELMGRDFDAWNERGRLIFQDRRGLEDLPAPNLPGEHQVANAGLAVAAIRALGDPRIGEDALAEGVSAAAWPARFQRLTAGPYGELAKARGADLWLDGGHNPHAARAVALQLERLAVDGRPVVIIVGLLDNKDAQGFLAPFVGVAQRMFATAFEADAAAPPDRLVDAARAVGFADAAPADTVRGALERALDSEGPPAHVLICGSLYLAGEVLAASPETWPR
jgi:dihydrofolate synthase / folylpolyglutamate synthase